MIAGGFIILGVVFLLLILTLSQEFVRVGATEAAYFQTLGVLLQVGRDLVNHIAMLLAVSLSGLMYYAMLYQTRLVPRWLSGWGLVGATLTLFAALLVMFRLIGIITTSYLVLSFPMVLQEMILAVWLIDNGFRQTEQIEQISFLIDITKHPTRYLGVCRIINQCLRPF